MDTQSTPPQPTPAPEHIEPLFAGLGHDARGDSSTSFGTPPARRTQRTGLRVFWLLVALSGLALLVWEQAF